MSDRCVRVSSKNTASLNIRFVNVAVRNGHFEFCRVTAEVKTATNEVPRRGIKTSTRHINRFQTDIKSSDNFSHRRSPSFSRKSSSPSLGQRSSVVRFEEFPKRRSAVVTSVPLATSDEASHGWLTNSALRSCNKGGISLASVLRNRRG